MHKCSIKFEKVNYLETARYIAASCDAWEIQRMGVRNLIPYRVKSSGTKPGSTGKQMLDGNSNNRDKFESWTFPKTNFTTNEKKKTSWGSP